MIAGSISCGPRFRLPRQEIAWVLERFVVDHAHKQKGYAIGSKFFSVPAAAELVEWGERRVATELDSLRDSLARLPGKEVRVFVKDNEDLRREKYAAQQAAKAPKKEEQPAAAAAAGAASGSKPEGKKGGGNNNNNAGKSGGGAAKTEEAATIGHLDLRVGVVISAAAHPDGDTLYVEQVGDFLIAVFFFPSHARRRQIDVGEAAPRTIVSGIREHVPLDKFVGSRVLVMCNLKAKPLRGVESNGMIVCGSRTLDEEKKTKLVRLLEVRRFELFFFVFFF